MSRPPPRQPSQVIQVPFLVTGSKWTWRVDLDEDGNILWQLLDPTTGAWTTRHRFQRDGDLDSHGVSSDGVIF
jgi:hypothetical protein